MLDGEQQLLEERRSVYLAQWTTLGDVIIQLPTAYPLCDQINTTQRLNHLKEPEK